MSKSSRGGIARFAHGMVLPTAVVLGALLLVPIVLAFYLSLTKDKLGTGFGDFIGIRNYVNIFQNDSFWAAMKLSVIFTVLFVIFSTLIGLVMAIVIDKAPIGRRFMQAMLILPWATPWVVVGILWNRFAADPSGVSLARFLISLDIIKPHESLLAMPLPALILVVLGASWRQSCFSAMLFTAALKTVPPSVIEAGHVDGASAWQRLLRLKLPMISPVTGTVIIFNVIFGFLQFDVVYAMTGGGPANATRILPIMIYDTLYAQTKMGTGTALSMILAAVSLVVGFLVIRLTGKRADA